MNRLTQIILLLIGFNLNAQIPGSILNDFLLEDELMAVNSIDKFVEYDFKNIWLTNNDEFVYGIIGEDHQRIHIKFLSIKKKPFDEREYIVYGKTMVKQNVCEFSGVIQIIEIKGVKEFHYGVDDEFKNNGIKEQGIIIAQYSFSEFQEQSHSGNFDGNLISKWYLTENDEIVYDDIQSISDGYTNNAFIGTWTNHTNGQSKLCNWADYRVPLAKRGFDIGAGEFSVSKSYMNKGWMDTILKNKSPNMAIEHESKSKSKKAWWE